MKIYDAILTKEGYFRDCRFCNRTARVRARKGGCVYCLDHYLIEVGKSCSLGGNLARRKMDKIPIIGIWLTAILRMGFAQQHVMKYYPNIIIRGISLMPTSCPGRGTTP